MAVAKRRRFPNLLKRLWAAASAEPVQIQSRIFYSTPPRKPNVISQEIRFNTWMGAVEDHSNRIVVFEGEEIAYRTATRNDQQ